jgi:uncharacterized membrane protein (UPF0127 family)
MIKLKHVLLALALTVIVGAIIIASLFGDTTTVGYPGGSFEVLLANNSFEHTKGLSGGELDDFKADGMLFTFNNKEKREFWMNGMKFDLDVVWIIDGKVMKIDKNVQAPEEGETPERIKSQPFEVDMVLELPAGTVDEVGIVLGHILTFDLD